MTAFLPTNSELKVAAVALIILAGFIVYVLAEYLWNNRRKP